MDMFLTELQHVAEHTHRDPGVIIISGPGGIGKTKLLRAMKAKAANMGFRYNAHHFCNIDVIPVHVSFPLSFWFVLH